MINSVDSMIEGLTMCRLQHIESTNSAMSSKVKHIKALATSQENISMDHQMMIRMIECFMVCRLQHIESTHCAMSSEVEHIKALGSHIEGWKHQMNDAGAQAAAVLALVQSDGSEIRYAQA